MRSDITYVEIKTENGIQKYEHMSGDIDTFMVSSEDIDITKEGFLVKDFLRRDRKCIIVKKKDVVAYYRYQVREEKDFLGLPCICEETPEGIKCILVRDPGEYKELFTLEHYYINRGEDYPPIPDKRYYIIVSENDERLRRKTIEKRTDYSVNTYGITEDMTEEERQSCIIQYVRNRMGGYSWSFESISGVLLGTYGYEIPDALYSTNLDAVFEEIIPYVYEENKEKIWLGHLSNAIVNAWSTAGLHEQKWIVNGKKICPNENYLFLMNIRIHLKLMEMHKKGIAPYNRLNLEKISYWLEQSYAGYLEKHEAVYWSGHLVCEDFGEFVKNAMSELEYFKQFE